MIVLLNLLEAHRRTMEEVNRSMRPPSPKIDTAAKTITSDSMRTTDGLTN